MGEDLEQIKGTDLGILNVTYVQISYIQIINLSLLKNSETSVFTCQFLVVFYY